MFAQRRRVIDEVRSVGRPVDEAAVPERRVKLWVGPIRVRQEQIQCTVFTPAV